MSEHPNVVLLRRFYEAFQRRDAATMGACYAPDVRFSDPVFPALQGDDARRMWAMLCARGKDLRIEFGDLRADESGGTAHWEAWYTFSGTGRPVHNVIDAEFDFREGRIVRHRDRFDLWRWTRQALGPTGLLLGWSPLVQGKVRAQASRALREWSPRP